MRVALGQRLVGGVALRAAERVGEGEAQLVFAHVPLQVVHASQQLLPVRSVQRLGLGGGGVRVGQLSVLLRAICGAKAAW